MHADSIGWPLLAKINVTGSREGDAWKTITTAVKNINGIHDLFFVFRGEKDLFNFDFWRFNASHP